MRLILLLLKISLIKKSFIKDFIARYLGHYYARNPLQLEATININFKITFLCLRRFKVFIHFSSDITFNSILIKKINIKLN